MKLIVGLGNPSQKYQHTRHNLGFMVVDKLATEHGGTWATFNAHGQTCTLTLGDEAVVLLKPQTFMNESGTSVVEVVQFFKVDQIDTWVVHDDLDLPLSTVRASFDSSSAGHRGVQSIIDALGSQKFHRLRLGIGRPPENIPAEAFVLQPFTPEEQERLTATIPLAIQTLVDSLKK